MCHVCDAKEPGVSDDGVRVVRSVEEFKDLFAELTAGQAQPSAGERAEAEMDQQVETILTGLRERMKAHHATDPTLVTEPTGIYAVTEGFAADLMFRQQPPAIAWTAAILAHRYLTLLAQWADLYVHENGSDLEDVAGLQPEQERAVTESPRTPAPPATAADEHRTGQYL